MRRSSGRHLATGRGAADHGTNAMPVLQGCGPCVVRLRSVNAVEQPADADSLIVAPRIEEIMGSAQVIEQGAAAVRILVGVQIEEEVEVFLVNHVRPIQGRA